MSVGTLLSNTLVLGTTELRRCQGTATSYQIDPPASGYSLTLFGFIGESWKLALHYELATDREVNKRKFILRDEAAILLELIVATCAEAILDPTKSIPLHRTIDCRCWKSLQKMPLAKDKKIAFLNELYHRHIQILEVLPEFLPLHQLHQVIQPVRTSVFRGWEVLLRESQFKIVEWSIHLSEEERGYLQLGVDEPSPDLTRLDCAGYAMLKVREPRAVSWIKTCLSPEEYYQSNTIEFLKGWGYRVIETPQLGSLVLYFSDALIPTRPDLMHTAIYLEDGIVQSKLGINNAVYKHRLENVPALYGNRVMFMAQR